MDVGNPYADVIPGPRGRLLITLAQLETAVTVRALARHSDVSPQRARDYVNELNDAGLAFAERVGSAVMVSLNRQHLLAEPILALAATRGRLIDRLREELHAWDDLAGAWLFGSTARGDGGRASDLDLLLVAESTTEAPGWVNATSRLREQANHWTGNEVQLIEHTRSSFGNLVAHANALVAAVRSEGIALTADSRALLRNVA